MGAEAVNPPAAPRRIVVKVGTSTLTNATGGLDRAFIADLTAQLAAERAAGREILLVTSGAIRAGREALEGVHAFRYAGVHDLSFRIPERLSTLPYKQAAAAVGQGLLMHTYTEAFAWRSVAVAQVLLTRDDLADRRRFLNARNTLTALLSLGVVPIVNENDTVAVDEIRFGDNDQLAAHVAVLVEADLLLILSDVDGLYERPCDPAAPNLTSASGGPRAAGPSLPVPPSCGTGRRHPKSTVGAAPAQAADDLATSSAPAKPVPSVIPTVARIDVRIEALAGETTSGVGTGGMRTKVEAARIATASGIRTVIAAGRRERVIADVIVGEPIGTTFLPGSGRLRGRKRWIAAGSQPRGSVTVNAGAAARLRQDGVSLLAVGITALAGDFAVGDLIEVRDETGRRFARGLTNYGAADLRKIQGLRTDQFEAVLGSKTYDEVIHRDNLVVET